MFVYTSIIIYIGRCYTSIIISSSSCCPVIIIDCQIIYARQPCLVCPLDIFAFSLSFVVASYCHLCLSFSSILQRNSSFHFIKVLWWWKENVFGLWRLDLPISFVSEVNFKSNLAKWQILLLLLESSPPLLQMGMLHRLHIVKAWLPSMHSFLSMSIWPMAFKYHISTGKIFIRCSSNSIFLMLLFLSSYSFSNDSAKLSL